MSKKARIKIGYALGGGAARGLSHIGVLKVLEENGIYPDIIAGTSIGAIIGALYAGGYRPIDIEELVLGLDWQKMVHLVDMILPRSGLLQGKRVMVLLKSVLGDLTFSQLRWKFACVATDIVNGQQVVLRDGSLIDAIRASISIPGIFAPVTISGRYLVDGGLTNTVPVSVCRDMGAGYVIGVNVVPDPGKAASNTKIKVAEIEKKTELAARSEIEGHSLRSRITDIENAARLFLETHRPKSGSGVLRSSDTSHHPLRTKPPGLIHVLSQAWTIAEYRIAMDNLKGADLAINPDLDEIGFWQFNHAAQAIMAGEQAARRVIKDSKLPAFSA
jgi:NTE family protein